MVLLVSTATVCAAIWEDAYGQLLADEYVEYTPAQAALAITEFVGFKEDRYLKDSKRSPFDGDYRHFSFKSTGTEAVNDAFH